MGAVTASPGSTVSLPLSFTASANSPASALMWVIGFSQNSVSAVSVTAGTVSTTAGKSVVCALAAPGRYKCVLSGSNANVIGSGVAATLSLTIASQAPAGASAIQLSELLAASPSGDAATLGGISGSVTIEQVVPILQSLVCSPGSLTVPGSAQCTVTISRAAPAGGTAIALGSIATGAIVTVPASVTIPQGAAQASFSVQVLSATAAGTLQITATLAGVSRAASIALVLPVPVKVSISPIFDLIYAGQSKQYTAAVEGAANTGVTWAISPALGSISSSGLYRAPSQIPSNSLIVVSGTSAADPSQYGVALLFLIESSAADTTAPVISSVTAAPGTGSAVIQWMTDEPATSRVEFGLSANALSSVVSDAALTTTHRLTLTGLVPKTAYFFRVSSSDAAGNSSVSPAAAAHTFTTLSEPFTLFSGMVPAVSADSDGRGVELGLQFYADTDGSVPGIRFYKGTTNRGTHTGTLWTAAGQKLASGTFSGETASGWQTMTFAEPVAIRANTTYVVSYFAPSGHYAINVRYFNGNAVHRSPLHIPGGYAGVYRYGSESGFPSATYQGSNYWVDLLFLPK